MRHVPGLLAAIILLIPRPAHAQATPPAPAPAEPRFFLDLNLGAAQSHSKSREFRSEFITFSELASMKAVYPEPSGSNFPTFLVGGGVMFSPGFGVGASYSRTVYEDSADLTATIPDPEFLGAAATGQGVTSASLTRKESAIHVSLVFVPVRTTRTRWRFYGGPTFFSYRADMVSDVAYASNLTRPQTALAVTGFSSEETRGDGVGIHIGGDFEYLLNRLLGITAGARYDDANVTVEREPLSALEQTLRVGGLHFAAGVRFHLGR